MIVGRLHRFKKQITQIILLSTLYSLLSTTIGCDAFVRKFTRKPKHEPPKEEMVLAPEEYKPEMLSKEDLYRQHFLFWKSWQDELVAALSNEGIQKKRLDCLNEAVKNLMELRLLLNVENQKKLDIQLGQLQALSEDIIRDRYGSNLDSHCRQAEKIKRNILKGFSYKKISKDLI